MVVTSDELRSRLIDGPSRGCSVDTDDRLAADAASGVARAVIDATLDSIARFGLSKTTVDDIVRASGVSRATIYRTFPGGRDGVVTAALLAEVDRFVDGLRAEMDVAAGLEATVTAALGHALEFLATHAALRAVLEIEPGIVVPLFAFHRLDRVLDLGVELLGPHLAAYLPAEDAASLAEHLVRVCLTYATAPSLYVDPTDRVSVRRLVRHHILDPHLSANPSL